MRNVIVIGASSGIGRELAVKYLEIGDTVFVGARRTELLRELHLKYHDNSEYFYIDIADNQNASKILSDIFKQIKGVDLVLLCAGTGELNSELSFEAEKTTIDTNVTGFTFVVDACFNYFKRQGFGHLVVLTSIAGLRGSAAAPGYNASKAFQINYLEGLRIKARKEHLPIFLTDVRPGFVDTAMAKGEGLIFVAPVAKAAKQIMDAIEKRKARVYVTKRWSILAWLFRSLPFSIYSKL